MNYSGKSAKIVQNSKCETSLCSGFFHGGKKKSQQP